MKSCNIAFLSSTEQLSSVLKKIQYNPGQHWGNDLMPVWLWFAYLEGCNVICGIWGNRKSLQFFEEAQCCAVPMKMQLPRSGSWLCKISFPKYLGAFGLPMWTERVPTTMPWPQCSPGIVTKCCRHESRRIAAAPHSKISSSPAKKKQTAAIVCLHQFVCMCVCNTWAFRWCKSSSPVFHDCFSW